MLFNFNHEVILTPLLTWNSVRKFLVDIFECLRVNWPHIGTFCDGWFIVYPIDFFSKEFQINLRTGLSGKMKIVNSIIDIGIMCNPFWGSIVRAIILIGWVNMNFSTPNDRIKNPMNSVVFCLILFLKVVMIINPPSLVWYCCLHIYWFKYFAKIAWTSSVLKYSANSLNNFNLESMLSAEDIIFEDGAKYNV